jgi:F-type H+-transporting ATPase subunit c
VFRFLRKEDKKMDYKAILAVALPVGLAIVAFGSAMALGKAVSSAMDATGRQPEAATKILINMATGCAFIEALTIYALVFTFALAGKL